MRQKNLLKTDLKAKAQPFTFNLGRLIAHEIQKRNESFRQVEVKLGFSTGSISRFVSMNIRGGQFVHVNLEQLQEVAFYLGFESLSSMIKASEEKDWS